MTDTIHYRRNRLVSCHAVETATYAASRATDRRRAGTGDTLSEVFGE
jgi:hypothetical protein